VGEIVKTFSHNGKAFGIEKNKRGVCTLVRQGRDGVYREAEGWHRSSREAFEYALRKWPEYLDRPGV
jgi:hypothetical protein